MCFTVVNKAIQAEVDIECYKVMIDLPDGKVNSCCFPVKGGYSMEETILGEGALHGHPRRFAKMLSGLSILSSQVVHSFINYDFAKKVCFWYKFYGHSHFCIVKCVIPKGTWYWYNGKDSEYASFKLKLIKLM